MVGGSSDALIIIESYAPRYAVMSLTYKSVFIAILNDEFAEYEESVVGAIRKSYSYSNNKVNI